MSRGRYAKGSMAWGICQRCGLRFFLSELQFDGWMPGLRVCSGCWEARQPQERLIDVSDPVALWRPSPEQGKRGSELELIGGSTHIFLAWSPAKPEGGPRIETYTVYRQIVNSDGSFGPPVQLDLQRVVYNDFAKILYQPASFDDVHVDAGVTYQYFVVAADNEGHGVPSNLARFTVPTPPVYSYAEAMNSTGDFIAGALFTAVIFSSRPYPAEVIEAMNSTGDLRNSPQFQFPEALNMAGDLRAGTNRVVLITYSNAAPEAINSVGDFRAGTNVSKLITYSNAAPEAINSVGDFRAGSNLVKLIQYSMHAEALNISGDFLGGTNS